MASSSDTEEDDYLTMTFADDPSSKKKKETSLQRRDRLDKSATERSKVLSKSERLAKEREELEASDARPLDASNRGAQMLARMGFTGGALGRSASDARTQPIGIAFKSDRHGIGLDSERKRKFEAEAEGVEASKRVSTREFRERNRAAREERRAEGAMWAAMKTLEEIEEGKGGVGEENDSEREERLDRPLRSVNLLYRPLVRQRVEREGEGRMRMEVLKSLSRGGGDDGSETEEDGDEGKPEAGTQVEDDLGEEDGEMERFEALSFAERLEKITKYLRERHRFCFWCKFKYPDAEMEGCPGLTEEDHD